MLKNYRRCNVSLAIEKMVDMARFRFQLHRVSVRGIINLSINSPLQFFEKARGAFTMKFKKALEK